MTPPAAAHARLPEPLLLGALTDAVLVRDADGEIVTANPAAHDLLGDDLAGAASLPGAPCEGRPVRLRRPGRSTLSLEVTAAALPDGGELVVATDRTDRARLVALTAGQHEVTRILSESPSVADAGGPLVAAIAGQLTAELEMPWQAGTLWVAEGDTLECVVHWDSTDASRATARSAGARVRPGEALAGRAWASGEPICHDDLAREDAPWRREDLAADGFTCGLGIPVTADGQTVGVLELFSREPTAPIAPQDAATAAGEQLGEWIRRRRAEEHLARTAQELEQRNDDLERSNAELEQFAYVASHDLSEPLRMVSSYVQLLQRRYGGQLGPDADEFIGYAVDGATRMRALIDDLLVYSRVGRAERGTATVDLAVLLAGTLRGLSTAIADKGATVEVVTELPSVLGDGTMLGQLLQNLVANALKFTAGAAPHVRVGCTAIPGGWEFSVRDNGIGIDPEHADRIFKMFQRLHRRDQYEGTGIGLAVCRKIVERHGGRIWVQPSDAGGSDFRFTIADGVEASP